MSTRADWELYYNEYGNEAWYNSATGEDTLTKPLVLQYSEDEVFLLVLLQALIRGRQCRARLRWTALFSRLDSADRAATRFERRGKPMRAILELEHARDVLMPHKNDHLQRWAVLLSRLRNLCTDTQTKLYWDGMRAAEAYEFRTALSSLGQARHAVKVLGHKAGLYQSKIPQLITSECTIALKLVACRVAAAMVESGMKPKRARKALERMKLLHHCDDDQSGGVPRHLWKDASGITADNLELNAREKRNAMREKIHKRRRQHKRRGGRSGSSDGGSGSSFGGSDNEQERRQQHHEETNPSDTARSDASGSDDEASVPESAPSSAPGSGSESSLRDSDSSDSDDGDREHERVLASLGGAEEETSHDIDSNLEQRIAGAARMCLRYQLDVEALIAEGMDRNLPVPNLLDALSGSEKEEEIDDFAYLEGRRGRASSSAENSSDSSSLSSSGGDDDNDDADHSASRPKPKTKSKTKKSAAKKEYQPKTLGQFSAFLRATQCRLGLLLHELLLGDEKSKRKMNERGITPALLDTLTTSLDPLLTHIVLDLNTAPPLNGENPTSTSTAKAKQKRRRKAPPGGLPPGPATRAQYLCLRDQAAEALADCRIRIHRTVVDRIDEDWDKLDLRTNREKSRKRKGMWVCTTCYLVNQPTFFSCSACRSAPEQYLTQEEERQQQLRVKLRTLHLRASCRAQDSAKLFKNIAKEYPLQTAVLAERQFYVLDARSKVCAARVMPLDWNPPPKKNNKRKDIGTDGKKNGDRGDADDAAGAAALQELAHLTSMELAKSADDALSFHWRHSTTLLLETRVLLYATIWHRLKTNFNRACQLFQIREVGSVVHAKSASKRFRVLGKQISALLPSLQEEISSERGRSRRDYVWNFSTATADNKIPIELRHWGPRVSFCEPLGVSVGVMEFIGADILALQRAPPQPSSLLGDDDDDGGGASSVDNPVLSLCLEFERQVRTLGVRALANAGAARDKCGLLSTAGHCYLEALDMLVKRPRKTFPVIGAARLLGVIRRHYAMSTTRKIGKDFHRGVKKFKMRDWMGACQHWDICAVDAPHQERIIRGFGMVHSAQNMRRLYMRSLGNLGRALEKCKQWDDAEAQYLECAKVARALEADVVRDGGAHGDRRPEVQALMRIALLYVDRNDFETSTRMLLAKRRCESVLEACTSTCTINSLTTAQPPDLHAKLPDLTEQHPAVEKEKRHHDVVLEPPPALASWLGDAQLSAIRLMGAMHWWRDVEKRGQRHYRATQICRFWRTCMVKKFRADMRREIWRRCATLLQACYRRYAAKRLAEWKRIIRYTKRFLIPIRNRTVAKLQTWWKRRFVEIKEGRAAAHYFATEIQRYYRGHRERHTRHPRRKARAIARARRSVHQDCALLIQKNYRGWWARLHHAQMLKEFREAVWKEYLDEHALKIQCLVRHFLGVARREHIRMLRRNATILALRETSATSIQSRLYRGPRDRQRAHLLASVRQIQKIFRGFYVRRREFRVWRSLGALARRPKPTKRKTSFLGAAKCHLFSEGPNNWELKERVGEIPDDILHSVGFAKKSSHRKVPIRTPFFDRRRQAHSRKLRAEEVAAEERRRQEGVFECRKCKQRGKFAGHICCCHLRPSCVSCQKNQRSWRVNGRPGKRRCDARPALKLAVAQ